MTKQVINRPMIKQVISRVFAYWPVFEIDYLYEWMQRFEQFVKSFIRRKSIRNKEVIFAGIREEAKGEYRPQSSSL